MSKPSQRREGIWVLEFRSGLGARWYATGCAGLDRATVTRQMYEWQERNPDDHARVRRYYAKQEGGK